MMYFSRFFRIVSFAPILLLIGCDGTQPPTTLTTINPANGVVYPIQTVPGGGYEGERPSAIRAMFSKGLRPETVNTNTFEVTMRGLAHNVITGVTTYGEQRPVRGHIRYDSTDHSVTFEPDDGDFAHVTNSAGMINAEFTIHFHGEGDSGIIDEDGLALDGDGDGLEGGDFQSIFVIELGPY